MNIVLPLGNIKGVLAFFMSSKDIMSESRGNILSAYFCTCNPGSIVALVYPLGRNSIIPLFFRVIENLAKRPHSNYTRRTHTATLWTNIYKYSLA